MTVRSDGTDLQRLREVGSCYCIGIAPPAVAWSPDGHQIAVTVIGGRNLGSVRSDGLYSIHPDGSGWTHLASSTAVAHLAWQPLAAP